MAKHHTGSINIKRSRHGTTIRATGTAAQALFDAIVASTEAAASTQKPTDAAPAESTPPAALQHKP